MGQPEHKLPTLVANGVKEIDTKNSDRTMFYDNNNVIAPNYVSHYLLFALLVNIRLLTTVTKHRCRKTLFSYVTCAWVSFNFKMNPNSLKTSLFTD